MRGVVLAVKGDGAQVGAVQDLCCLGRVGVQSVVGLGVEEAVYVRKVVRDRCPVNLVADCGSRLRRLEVEFGCGPDWPWKRIGWSSRRSLGLERWVGG